jgi:hypothetical protein
VDADTRNREVLPLELELDPLDQQDLGLDADLAPED